MWASNGPLLLSRNAGVPTHSLLENTMTRQEFIYRGCQDDLDGGMDPDPEYWGEQYDFYFADELNECSSVTILWLSGE